MIKKFRKKLFTISIVIFMLLGCSISTFEYTNNIFDNAEILSSYSQSVIEERIDEFEKVTHLDLKIATTVKLEQGNLLDNAKRLNKLFNKNGYLILVATDIPQRMNNLTPAIAIAPSPKQFNKLEKFHYDRIVNDFQIDKQTNLPKAILTSIDSLQTQVYQQQSLERQNLYGWMSLAFIASLLGFLWWIIKSGNNKSGYERSSSTEANSETTTLICETGSGYHSRNRNSASHCSSNAGSSCGGGGGGGSCGGGGCGGG